MVANINQLVSAEEQASLSPSELETLHQYGDLYRRIRNKDLFGTAAGTLAAIGDIMGGGVTATSLLSRRQGPGDMFKRKSELLATLAEYQNARREERGRVEAARVTGISEIAQKEADLKEFALGERVKMYNTQVDASKSIQVAQLNRYDNAVNAADQTVIKLSPPGNAVQATNQMKDSTRRTYNVDLIPQLELLRATDGVTSLEIAKLIGTHTGGMSDEEVALTIKALEFQYDKTALDIDTVTKAMPTEGVLANPFRKSMGRAIQGEKARKSRFEQAETDRDNITTEYMRGWGVSKGHPLEKDLIALQNAKGAGGVSDAMGSMGIQIPEALQAQTQDRGLEDDDTVRRLKAELAKLDDPRFLFPGSPHEQLRQKIEGSPEYQKWKGETYGDGPVEPNSSFSQFLAVTKGELTPTASMNAMNASNALTGAASVPLVGKSDALRSTLSRGSGGKPIIGQYQQPSVTRPSTVGKVSIPGSGAPNLGEMYQKGAQRKSMGGLTDSNAESPLLASAAQGYSKRLREALTTPKDEDKTN